MKKDLILILEDIKKKFNKAYDGKKRDRLINLIEKLILDYKNLEIPENHVEIYQSLVKRGNELLKESNIKDYKKVSYYLRYCTAVEYDLIDNIKPLNLIVKSFLLTCALFFVLAPQYFSYILPLIFVIPIYMGLRGMKKRILNGLMIGVSVVPMGILVAMIWLRNAYLTMGNFDEFAGGIARQYNMSMELTQGLAAANIIMSVVLLGSSIVLLVSAIKYRNMFI